MAVIALLTAIISSWMPSSSSTAAANHSLGGRSGREWNRASASMPTTARVAQVDDRLIHHGHAAPGEEPVDLASLRRAMLVSDLLAAQL